MARSQMPDKKLRIVRERSTQKLRASPPIGFCRGQLKAVYGDQQKVWRIAYVANGRWCLQQYVVRDDEDDCRYVQCWFDYGRPTDYETAFSQLKRRDNMQQASA